MAVDNRLTATLAPGDSVTIEFVRDYHRPKHVAGEREGLWGGLLPQERRALRRSAA